MNSQSSPTITVSDLARRVQQHVDTTLPQMQRLWDYYRNPLLTGNADALLNSDSDRPYRQAQEWGLPARITGVVRSINSTPSTPASASSMTGVARKEVVIENDIGWRIETLVDYLFGKPIVINSSAADPARRAIIEQLLRQILAHNGGIIFLQQLALMGAVYGFVDVLVKLNATDSGISSAMGDLQALGQPAQSNGDSQEQSSDRDGEGEVDASALPPAESASVPAGAGANQPAPDSLPAELTRFAQRIRLEIVEPTRALPLLDPNDYRHVLAYAQVYSMPAGNDARNSSRQNSRNWLEKIFPRFFTSANGFSQEDQMTVVDLLTPTTWQRYEDQTLVDQGNNSLGELPLVHIQNSALPFEYAGASDVAPLLSLQDELNTRLSDRAYRITMQSFKMYLGKGIDNFGELPIAPGRMWMTENEGASVQEFGGDSESPSEESHIEQIRDAMDKTSSVTPIAAGAIKGRIGNLTSAVALRVTMQALLSKTDRKRILYGEGIKRMCELSLAWLDRAGIFRTSPEERSVELNWPSALPDNESDRLADAQSKLRLGVPRDIVLRELGYPAS